VYRLVIRLRVPILIVSALITAFFARQIPNLRFEPDAEAYVPENHPVRVFWQEAKDRFGLGREILVAVQATGPGGVFTPRVLAGLSALTDALEKVDGVDSSQVRSLATAEAMIGTEDGLDVQRFYEEPPTSLEQALAIREMVFRNPVFLDRLVSRDGTIAAIFVKTELPEKQGTLVYARVQDVVDRHPIDGARVLVAGMPAIEYVYGRQMAADLERLIPLALAAVVAILYFCFPTVSLRTVAFRGAVILGAAMAWQAVHGSSWPFGHIFLGSVIAGLLTVGCVFFPAAVVAMSVVWTWGLQAMLDMPIYIAGTLVPPLLLAIGCADAIHITEGYHERMRSPGADKNQSVVEAMQEAWLPVVLTSLTNAAGFGSLIFGSMEVYRVFGITAASGLLVAMVLSVTFLPAGLAVLPAPRSQMHRPGSSALTRFLVAMAERLEARRLLVLGWTTAVIALFGFYAAYLKVDYSWVESLAPDTPVLEADRILRTHHGGTTPMNVIVRAPEVDGIKDPELLRAIDRVLDSIAEHPAVGDTRSIAEYIKRMNQAMNADRPEALRIPDSRDLVAQYLLFYSMSGDPTEYDDLSDYDYQAANLSILLRTDRLSAIHAVDDRLTALLEEHLAPLGATSTITGSANVLETILGMVVDSQVGSLGSATAMVGIFLWIFFRSLRDALICLLPMLVTAVVNFGGMTMLGIPLGPDKAMISAIALGLGIDYSIHLMSRFHRHLAAGMTVTQGVVESMRGTGRAILFNGAVVVAGFLVLGTSATPSNATFGLMIASNIVLACVTAMVVVPAALAVVGYVEARRAERRPVRIGGHLFQARTARALGLGAGPQLIRPGESGTEPSRARS
jgi:predicted RND superfamily exporter protein